MEVKNENERKMPLKKKKTRNKERSESKDEMLQRGGRQKFLNVNIKKNIQRQKE